MEINVVYPSQNLLGEGPVWCPEEGALYWVDIHYPSLQRLHLESGDYQSWEMPADIGCFALRKLGGFVVGLRNGFAFFDPASKTTIPIEETEAHLPFTRINDGKCDRAGRFWAGSMDEEYPNRRGALYRLDGDQKITQMRGEVGISNGLGWSPDNRTMYYTDSTTHTIYAYDFDFMRGAISNERVFATTPEAYVPDGLTVDAEGYIWSAKWDGWKIVRYAPDGSVERELALPVQRPTSCVFGGPNMTQLFITSARMDLSAADLAKQPQAGSLFVVETGIPGLPEPRYAG